MTLKRLQKKERTRHLRLRVESCISTILDLNRQLGEGKIKPEVILQFEKLRESLDYVNDDTADEKDISRIEEATNQLLAEIRMSCGEEGIKALHDGRSH